MGKNKHVDLFNDMIPAVDMNIKELWDAVTDEGRKEIKGDMWNLNRYISNVDTKDKEVQQHYVLTVNEYYNKNWNDLYKNHPKLLWMLLCMCNFDGKTKYFHKWLPMAKTPVDKKTKFLMELYPDMRTDEVELLAKINTDKDIKELAKLHGMDDAEIKKKFR
jgi:hypothetical protein